MRRASYSPQGHTQQETNAQGTKDYHYNAAERLIRFTNTLQGQNEPSIEAHYRYDPFGRRISKATTQGASSNSSTTWFVYGTLGLMAEANEQGELTKAYGFNPVAAQQGLWSTDPIWQANVADNALNSTETTYHYLHTDHLYTPILATNKEGSITWKAVQEAFGTMSALQGQSRISMNLRFPGQYYDVETGTHYNFHRDYRPNAGRYVQSDPIGINGGLNTYGYVGGNPLSLTDALGLAPGDLFDTEAEARADALSYKDSVNNSLGRWLYGNMIIGFRVYKASECLWTYETQSPVQGIAPPLGPKGPYKINKPGVSGKEGAKNAPSWAKGERPFKGESGNDFATRMLDSKYGVGQYPKGAASEFNQIRKWGDRSFVD